MGKIVKAIKVIVAAVLLALKVLCWLKNTLKPEFISLNLGFCKLPYPANFKAGMKLVGFTFLVVPPLPPIVAPAIASAAMGALLLLTLPLKLVAR